MTSGHYDCTFYLSVWTLGLVPKLKVLVINLHLVSWAQVAEIWALVSSNKILSLENRLLRVSFLELAIQLFRLQMMICWFKWSLIIVGHYCCLETCSLMALCLQMISYCPVWHQERRTSGTHSLPLLQLARWYAFDTERLGKPRLRISDHFHYLVLAMKVF